LPTQRGKPFHALDLHQAADAHRRCPPQHAALQKAAAEGREVPPRQRRLFIVRQLREAQAEIGQRDMAPLLAEAVEQPAE